MRNARLYLGLTVLALMAALIPNLGDNARTSEPESIAQCGGFEALQASPYYASSCAMSSYGSACGVRSYGSSCNGGYQGYQMPAYSPPTNYYSYPQAPAYGGYYQAPVAYSSVPQYRLVCGPNGCYYQRVR